jgi:succinoglycan biosynthesis protein ExoV
VLDALQKTRALLTEGLHGAIVADAFRIPWTAIKSSPALLDFKWEDWCRSIGIAYQPEMIQPLWQPSGTLAGRLRFSLKTWLARNELKRISRRRRDQLSKEHIFNAARARLIEKVGDFRVQASKLYQCSSRFTDKCPR